MFWLGTLAGIIIAISAIGTWAVCKAAAMSEEEYNREEADGEHRN